MIRLFYIEWIKWKRFSPLLIIISLYTILFFLICFGLDKIIIDKVASNFTEDSFNSTNFLRQFNPYKFPNSWHTFAYLGKFFKILLAIILINIISYEFQNGTFKQNVIHGLKRWEYLFGKLLLVFLLSCFSTFLVGIASITGGLIYSSVAEMAFFENVNYLFLSFINTFTYLSLAVMMGVLLRNTMTAFVILMLLWFPGDLLWLSIIPDEFSIFRPFEVIDELLPFSEHEISVWKLIVVCFMYQLLYWLVSYLKIKRDLT